MRRLALTILLAGMPLGAVADEIDQAIRMHNRLTGTPPSPAVLEQMAGLISQGQLKEAALLATENENFLRVTIKNMVTPWTNEEESNLTPLNDYTATLIGITRDDLSIKSVFTDITYVGADTLGLPAYSNGNNDHYEAFEAGGFEYSDPQSFVQQPQTLLTGFEVGAGVLTSRGFSAAYYDAGTNRLPFAHVAATYLCRPIEKLHDNTRPKSWIRQDVSRAPGGDVNQYLAKCSGCHGLMDGLTPAFAHNDFVDGENIYDSTNIPAKMTRNADVFPDGRRIDSDAWVNFMTEGPNANIGWLNAPPQGLYQGQGVVEFGEMIVATEALAPCMAQHALKQVCLMSGNSEEDQTLALELAADFSANGYVMRDLFATAATKCAGE